MSLMSELIAEQILAEFHPGHADQSVHGHRWKGESPLVQGAHASQQALDRSKQAKTAEGHDTAAAAHEQAARIHRALAGKSSEENVTKSLQRTAGEHDTRAEGHRATAQAMRDEQSGKGAPIYDAAQWTSGRGNGYTIGRSLPSLLQKPPVGWKARGDTLVYEKDKSGGNEHGLAIELSKGGDGWPRMRIMQGQEERTFRGQAIHSGAALAHQIIKGAKNVNPQEYGWEEL